MSSSIVNVLLLVYCDHRCAECMEGFPVWRYSHSVAGTVMMFGTQGTNGTRVLLRNLCSPECCTFENQKVIGSRSQFLVLFAHCI